MSRVVVVDLLCNSPYYSGAITGALHDAGADAELASPQFYLEPDALDPYPRAPWMVELVIHVSRPRPVRLAVRAAEVAINASRLLIRILRGRYDTVHVQWVPLDTRSTFLMRVLRAACDRSGTVLAITAHNALPHDRPDANRALIRRNLERAHVVIALTDHVAAELAEVVGVRTPIAVVPHGPLFTDRPLPDQAVAAARFEGPPGPMILMLGLIRSYKGIDLLADAWPAVRDAHPDARLVVIGKVLDAAVLDDVDRLRAQPGVEVIGRYVSIAEMLEAHAASDLVAFPYHRISQSAGLMTAAALGKPSVITPVDGLLEQARTLTGIVIADDVSGPAVAAAIVDALNRLGELRFAAERDRDAIAASPVGWPAVARGTLDAYRVARERLASRRASARSSAT